MVYQRCGVGMTIEAARYELPRKEDCCGSSDATPVVRAGMVCQGNFADVSRTVLNPGRLHRQCLPLASSRASTNQQAGTDRNGKFGRHACVGWPSDRGTYGVASAG